MPVSRQFEMSDRTLSRLVRVKNVESDEPLSQAPITCVKNEGDDFYFGNTKGCVRKYKRVRSRDTEEWSVFFVVERSFAGPITAIELLPSLSLLIVLQSGQITIHKCSSLLMKVFVPLPLDKPASCFAVRKPKHELDTDLYLAVAIRKRIILYSTLSGSLSQYKEFNLPATPVSIEWCQNQLMIAFNREYSLLDVVTGDRKSVV
eukprot:TRINITY_DN3352_c0_g4_i5.p1 TRINITY_DN3352_c0_g4~~TRINITY_DN3352_c0_g4_i5.p1  ORF type:complete len:204 (+),score=36.96 TRINITY_DN3352_c0_g4_i5:611-1222(+)